MRPQNVRDMGAYWVAGVGNEVFVGVGALSVVVVLFTYFLIKTIAIRPRCVWAAV